MSEKNKDGLQLLRKPFAENQISLLPKPLKKDSPKGNCRECGGYHGLPAVHLKYVGHAALTDRLLDVDPEWTWEPLSIGNDGLPALDSNGGMWIKLTVLGVTRLGYGDAQGKTGGDAVKERIGDALRNAAMRFGAALDLWHKGDLHGDEDAPGDVAKKHDLDALLETLREASLNGVDALKKAVNDLPEGAEIDQLWATNKAALMLAAKRADATESLKKMPDDVPA